MKEKETEQAKQGREAGAGRGGRAQGLVAGRVERRGVRVSSMDGWVQRGAVHCDRKLPSQVPLPPGVAT